MRSEETAYITMISLGKALIDNENYEKSLINLEYAKKENEKAEKSDNASEKDWAKKVLEWTETTVSYYYCIKQGMITDPNPPSTTMMWLKADAALSKRTN